MLQVLSIIVIISYSVALLLLRVEEYELTVVNGKDKTARQTRLVYINPPASEMVHEESTEPSEYS